MARPQSIRSSLGWQCHRIQGWIGWTDVDVDHLLTTIRCWVGSICGCNPLQLRVMWMFILRLFQHNFSSGGGGLGKGEDCFWL